MIIFAWRQLEGISSRLLLVLSSTIVLTLLVPIPLASLVERVTCGKNCPTVFFFSIVDFIVVVIWFVTALVLMAWAANIAGSKTSEHVDLSVTPLADKIESQEDEFRRITTGHEDRLNSLETWVVDLRQALEEELGVKLPGRRHSVRAGSISHHWSTSIPEVTVGRSPHRMVRLRSWVKRQALRFWILTRKLVWDWDDDQAN